MLHTGDEQNPHLRETEGGKQALHSDAHLKWLSCCLFAQYLWAPVINQVCWAKLNAAGGDSAVPLLTSCNSYRGDKTEGGEKKKKDKHLEMVQGTGKQILSR